MLYICFYIAFIAYIVCVWIAEKPLDSYSPDLKNELYYKKYLIFPANGTRLVLKKKKEVPTDDPGPKSS